MGRKMKSNHALDEKECEWILGVIHRDFDLRRREQERLNKIETELNEAANQRSVLSKRKEFNEKCCVLCCSAFNLLFNKKLQCGNCQFYVCRNCAIWESSQKIWLCQVCEQQRVLYVQSCEWFYENIQRRFQRFGSAKILDQLRKKRKESSGGGVDSENDSGYGPAFSEGHYYKGASPLNPHSLFPGFDLNKLKKEGADASQGENGDAISRPGSNEEDVEAAEVKKHIETVVEGLVGEDLDSVRVDKAYSHPLYLQLFSDFHKPLVDATLKLGKALEVALLNKPCEEGEASPTTAHATLKHLIVQIGEKVAQLPCLQRCESSKMNNDDRRANQRGDTSRFANSCVFQSYEELLASALINKLVNQSQKLQYGTSGRESSQSEASASDNDVPILMKSSGKGVTSRGSSDTDASNSHSDPETVSLGGVDAADEFSWATNIGAQPPTVEYVIEERIEEITQEEYGDADQNEQKSTDKNRESSRKTITGRRGNLKRTSSSVDEDPLEKNIIGSPQNIPELDFLNAWDLVEERGDRVPFPEFGIDFVVSPHQDFRDLSEDEEEQEQESEVGTRPSADLAWEENWLFRKKKLFPYGSLRHQLLGFGEAPCLLIPNSHDSNAHAQIDSRDIDTLSDLSEQNSVGSLDFSDESDVESDKEVNSKESTELVRLAQNVAQHFSTQAYPATPSPKPAKSSPATKSPRLPSSNPKESRVGHSPQKHSIISTRSPLKGRNGGQPATPPPITLPVPAYLDPERRRSCLDPVFVYPPEDTTIHAGKMAQFLCQVKGTRPIGVSWFRECQLIKDDNRHEMVNYPEKGRYMLNLYDTDAGDAGIYSCVAYGQTGGQEWADFTLKIKASTRANCVPEFVVPLRVISSVPSRGAKLSCTLSGYPEPRVTLFHNRKQITHSPKHDIEYIGYGEWVMEIFNLDESDEGGYEVVASNTMGHAVSAITHRIGEVTPHPVLNERMEKKSEPSKDQGKRQAATTNNHRGNAANNINGSRNNNSRNDLTSTAVAIPTILPNDEISQNSPKFLIAERERLKWQNAEPLRNNPYSKENVIKKKLERRVSDLSLSDSPMSFEEFSKRREEADEVMLGRNGLAVSLEKEYERYKRDYYVHDSAGNSSGGSQYTRRTNSNKTNGVKNSKPKNVINHLEEKVYESASQLISLDNEVQQLQKDMIRANDLTGVKELEEKVAAALAVEEIARRKVSQVESEVKQIQEKRKLLRKSSVCSSSSDYSNYGQQEMSPAVNYRRRSSYTASSDEDVASALPSVKKLANLFVDPKMDKNNPDHLLNNKSYLDDEKEVVIVESDVSCSSNNQSSPTSSLQPNPGVSALRGQFLAPPNTKYQVEKRVLSQYDPLREKEQINICQDGVNPREENPAAKLPVVKLLSRQFTDREQPAAGAAASVQRVHSLTARSLSKEFRQLTQRNVPRPMNRTLSISSGSQPTSLDTDRSLSPSLPRGDDGVSSCRLNSEERETVSVSPGGGYTSDESSATSNPSSSLPRQKNKRSSMSKNILQRASYWERRAEHGLLSDNSVSEEFPSIEPGSDKKS